LILGDDVVDEDAEIVMILTDSYFSFNPNAGLNDDGSLKEGWAITKDRYDNLSDDDKEMFSPLAFIFSMNERDDQGKMPYYIEADEDIAEIYLYDPQNNDIGYSLEAGPGNEMEGYQAIPESIGDSWEEMSQHIGQSNDNTLAQFMVTEITTDIPTMKKYIDKMSKAKKAETITFGAEDLEYKFALIAKYPNLNLDVFDIPSDLDKIEKKHITLVGGKALKPYKGDLKDAKTILKDLPDPPQPSFGEEGVAFREGNDGEIRETFFASVANQEDFQDYADMVCDALGIPNPEPDRFFHMSVANNHGGNSFKSVGDISEADLEGYRAEGDGEIMTFGKIEYGWSTDPEDIPNEDSNFQKMERQVKNQIRSDLWEGKTSGHRGVITDYDDTGEEYEIDYGYTGHEFSGINSAEGTAFHAPDDAYAFSYNDGFKDGQTKSTYHPRPNATEKDVFREAFRNKNRAESFEAEDDVFYLVTFEVKDGEREYFHRSIYPADAKDMSDKELIAEEWAEEDPEDYDYKGFHWVYGEILVRVDSKKSMDSKVKKMFNDYGLYAESFGAEHENRPRDSKGRKVPKTGVSKWGNDYWPYGVTYQEWKYKHPASVRVFAEGHGVDIKNLTPEQKDWLKFRYMEDVDSKTSLKALVDEFGLSTKVSF